jgi:hypothetical protein
VSRFDIDLDDTEVRASLEELKHDATTEREYRVGTNVEYAVYLEFGTRYMPPYSFFRPALRELDANPNAFIARHTNTTVDAIDDADTLVQTLALALERAITQNANANASGRSPGTDPEHPKVQTSNLVNSIQATRIQ